MGASHAEARNRLDYSYINFTSGYMRVVGTLGMPHRRMNDTFGAFGHVSVVRLSQENVYYVLSVMAPEVFVQ